MNERVACYVQELSTATVEVFRMMAAQELSAETPVEGDTPRPVANVVAAVSFAGQESGAVAVYSTHDSARQITAGLLGIPPAAVNGEMPDAMGELANMIAGSFRTRMAENLAQPWAISVPTVTVGSDFCTKYLANVYRVLCPFKFEDGEVFVELILTR